jgi:hypothetical protein
MLPRVRPERRLSGRRTGAVVLLLGAQEEGAFRFGSFGAAHRATRSGVPAQEFLADLHPVPMKRSRS